MQLNTWFDYRRKRCWALALLLLYTCSGFLLAPWLLARNGPDLAQEYIQREVSIGDIRFNPWTLRLEIDDFQLIDTDERNLLSFDALIINVSFIDLLQLTLGFDEIRLQQPQVLLARYAFADTNWGRLLEELDSASATAAAPAETQNEAEDELPLYIASLAITDGVLTLEDTLTEKTFNTRIQPINISVNDLSTLENVSGQQTITLITENGVELTWQGSLELSPLVSAGTIQLSGTPLPTIHRYFEKQLGFTLNNCCLEIDLAYTLESAPDGDIEATVSEAELTLSNFNLNTKITDEPLLRLPTLRVSGGQLALAAQTVHIEEVALEKPELYLWLNEDGSLNLDKLVNSPPIASPPADSEINSVNESASETIAENEAAPWSVTLDAFRIADMRLGFSDRSLTTPGTLELYPLNLTIADINLEPNSRWPVTFASNLLSGGAINFAGSLVTDPDILATGKLSIDELALPVLQPWLADTASIKLESGTLDVTAELNTSPTETLQLAGDVAVLNLDISDTLKNESLIGWQRLGLQGLDFALDDNTVQIKRVEIDQPFARVIIAADGSTNFDSLSTEDTTAAPATDTDTARSAANEDAPPLSVKVGRTKVSDGSVDFADDSLPLPFRVLINEFTGNMSAIDSNSAQPSKLDFKGRVGEYGLTTLKGDVSVMAPDQQTAVQLDFQNLSMPTLSPYTAEFIGRKISSGKLDLALNYSLTDRLIDGQNNMVLKDFSLGEKVDSEEAMNLPIDLALALLTDSNGVIDLDMQVKGNMDDPGFSASGLILKTFANLITKAVAAPFKLLGGLIPGGADMGLDAIQFEPGVADLNPPEQEKLMQVVTALQERPALQLQLNGGYAVAADTAALQQINLDSSLRLITGNSEPSPKQIRNGLEKMMSQTFTDVSLRELRAEYNQPDPTTGKTTFDELAYAAELRRRLEAVQPVDAELLQTLGRQRRDMMLAFLESQTETDNTTVITGNITEVKTDDRGRVRVPLELTAVPNE